MTVAAAAYPLDLLDGWQAYADKQRAWVAEAAGRGAQLLVFPEYARMELAALDGADGAADPVRALHAAAARAEEADRLAWELAAEFGVTILTGSGPVFAPDAARPVNRAWLIGPDTHHGYQDKQVMTRYEREVLDMRPGEPLEVFHTPHGPLGILVCYDSEFPLLGRSLVERGAEILLVPACTEGLAGHSRVRVGAMARALEGQCVVVHAALVGDAPWCPVADRNTGAAAIYGPPDLGFPETGVIAQGALDRPGWTIATIERAAIARVRAEGCVLNHAHWAESAFRAGLFSDAGGPRGDLP